MSPLSDYEGRIRRSTPYWVPGDALLTQDSVNPLLDEDELRVRNSVGRVDLRPDDWTKSLVRARMAISTPTKSWRSTSSAW
jgi:hypothetical protein